MLIDEDRVAVRVHDDETGWPRGRLVRHLLQLHPLSLEPALQLADIRKSRQPLGIGVPAWVEGEDVLLEHALKKPDGVIPVLQDQPVLRSISCEGLEAKLLIEAPRRFQILDCQADRKRPEFHAVPLSLGKPTAAAGQARCKASPTTAGVAPCYIRQLT